MLKDYLFMAVDNLKHRGIRSWLTMIGIFIGIAAVVSLISLSNGLENAITGQFSSMSADTLLVQSASSFMGPPGTGAVRKLDQHDVDLIKSVPGVDMVIPRLLRTVKIEYNKFAKYKYLTSIPGDPELDNYMYTAMGLKVAEGRLLKNSDLGKIFIGSDFIGDEEFGTPVRLGSIIKIQGENYEVVGIMEKSGTLVVNNVGVVTQKEMESLLNIEDEFDMIMIKVTNKDRAEEVAELIKTKMRRDRDEKVGEEDFSVQTPLQAIESITLILNILNIIVVGIALVSLILGGVGIANTMYTSVLERKKEIGIMKAVGARNSEVLKIFLVESGLTGLVGGIGGAIIGLAFAFGASYAANAYFGQDLILVVISYPLVILAVTFSFLIGVISGLSPALQASNVRPVEALRS